MEQLRRLVTPSSVDFRKAWVLLCNLGGPETIEEVRPFLETLFSDPGIIRIRSSWLRRLLAWGISTLRYRSSQKLYAQIGGGSPLRRLTEAQGDALAQALRSRGIEAEVAIAMRCWHPNLDEVVPKILATSPTTLVVLPLFPQDSFTTTRSVVERVEELLRDTPDLECRFITSWHTHPKYIEAMVARIREGLDGLPPDETTTLLFSAHSIPLRYVREGDPYPQQIEASLRSIVARLEAEGISLPHRLAYQSRLGPIPWLGPSTEETIDALAQEGISSLLVVPLSFVSDHVETLYEIDILYRQRAQRLGIEHFRCTKGLNTDATFIECLVDLVSPYLQHHRKQRGTSPPEGGGKST
ncbi:MAG: ferrochelatase [Deltaproteobacteria bacterium]|nr:MAG: ferrochelatase [Deltaproteobacteria bacterium]